MTDKLINITLSTIVLALMLGLAEIGVRLMGYNPGDLSPVWFNFKPVDTLRVENYFYTNKEGILVADSTYWARQGISINEDGFRSPSFSGIDSCKKKVMFIGDSFAWGKSAEPLTGHCFVDLVRNETGYEVINLGIPGADPAQYYELAKKYIPTLKPDVVFVMFFMGNDLMTEDRKVVPGRPFCYATNAGMIFADIDGRFFPTAQQAYDYVSHEKYYLNNPSNYFDWVISKSALLSRLYSLKFRLMEKLAYERVAKESSITKKYLKGISDEANRYHADVKFGLIPEYKEAGLDTAKYKLRYADLLGDSTLRSDWLILQNSKANFIDYPDGHLNNAGHRYYADFLEKYLKQSNK
jgi:hypothetical protein